MKKGQAGRDERCLGKLVELLDSLQNRGYLAVMGQRRVVCHEHGVLDLSFGRRIQDLRELSANAGNLLLERLILGDLVLELALKRRLGVLEVGAE